MRFQPDLLVMAHDTPEVVMVIELKSLGSDILEAERQLKTYMIDRRCPLGMLVTPDRVRLYHDQYRGQTETSIDEVGNFSTLEVLGSSRHRIYGEHLEDAVRGWLEDVVGNWWSSLPASPSVRKQLLEHLVPAISEGRVMSGSPR